MPDFPDTPSRRVPRARMPVNALTHQFKLPARRPSSNVTRRSCRLPGPRRSAAWSAAVLGARDALAVAADVDDVAVVQQAVKRGGRGRCWRVSRKVLAARLSALDAARGVPTCGECGSRMRRRGPRRLSPVSLFGRLELKRGYWTCGCSKGGTHPLDAALGVGGRSGDRGSEIAAGGGRCNGATSCLQLRLLRRINIRTGRRWRPNQPAVGRILRLT